MDCPMQGISAAVSSLIQQVNQSSLHRLSKLGFLHLRLLLENRGYRLQLSSPHCLQHTHQTPLQLGCLLRRRQDSSTGEAGLTAATVRKGLLEFFGESGESIIRERTGFGDAFEEKSGAVAERVMREWPAVHHPQLPHKKDTFWGSYLSLTMAQLLATPASLQISRSRTEVELQGGSVSRLVRRDPPSSTALMKIRIFPRNCTVKR